MSSKQMVNVSVVSSQRQSEQTGLLISLDCVRRWAALDNAQAS